jgi:hypothetical protein
LARGLTKWGWEEKAVQEVFYKKRSVPIIPSSYEPIGTIYNYWADINVIGVEIFETEISKGDRIGYLTPTGFFEEEVSSLQIDNEDVQVASPNQKVGIKTIYPKEVLRKGMIVYKIS